MLVKSWWKCQTIIRKSEYFRMFKKRLFHQNTFQLLFYFWYNDCIFSKKTMLRLVSRFLVLRTSWAEFELNWTEFFQGWLFTFYKFCSTKKRCNLLRVLGFPILLSGHGVKAFMKALFWFNYVYIIGEREKIEHTYPVPIPKYVWRM